MFAAIPRNAHAPRPGNRRDRVVDLELYYELIAAIQAVPRATVDGLARGLVELLLSKARALRAASERERASERARAGIRTIRRLQLIRRHAVPRLGVLYWSLESQSKHVYKYMQSQSRAPNCARWHARIPDTAQRGCSTATSAGTVHVRYIYVHVHDTGHKALCPVSRPQNPGIMLDDGAGIHAWYMQ